MTEAGWIIIVQLITAAVVTIAGYITRQAVIGLKPEIVDVREQLKEANRVIAAQVTSISSLRDELAMRKPTMTAKRLDEDFSAHPPYKKSDPKT